MHSIRYIILIVIISLCVEACDALITIITTTIALNEDKKFNDRTTPGYYHTT